MAEERLIGLGTFVRARRQSFKPADIGLVPSGRRHVKGLRREEVAERAGIGLSWYTMLEQGRASGITDRTLARIAGALELTAVEREHLFALARASVRDVQQEPPAALLAFVESFSAGIAFLTTAAGTIVAWNRDAERLFAFASFPPDRRNLIADLVTGGRSRDALPDWERILGNMVAVLRANAGRRPSSELDALVSELTRESPLFERVWNESRVDDIPLHLCTVRFPDGTVEARQLFAFAPLQSVAHTFVTLVPPVATRVEA